MATPVQVNTHPSNSGATAGKEATAGADGTQVYTVTLVLGGTNANIQADYATLVATNFASPSAQIDWRRDS